MAFLFVTILHSYVITKSTRALPIPEAETEFETVDAYDILDVNFRSGNNTLAIIHIQKTAVKSNVTPIIPHPI